MASAVFSFLAASFLFLLVGINIVEGVEFSKLAETLMVNASVTQGQVLKAGKDKFTVSWMLKEGQKAGTDSSYKEVKLRLCYAPISQKDRGWRKTVDDLKKDKTCQFGITIKPYARSNTTYEYKVERDVPSGTYFIRAYVLDSSGTEVAYGQTTNAAKTANLFQIIAITGRHASLDIAAGCFSAFSVLSLTFFFVKEKRKGK